MVQDRQNPYPMLEGVPLHEIPIATQEHWATIAELRDHAIRRSYWMQAGSIIVSLVGVAMVWFCLRRGNQLSILLAYVNAGVAAVNLYSVRLQWIIRRNWRSIRIPYLDFQP
jgi:hypothetical protein